jgi:hypothetical protein
MDINVETAHSDNAFLLSRSGDSQGLLSLIENRFSVNAQDGAGFTALHYSCSHGHTECTRQLVLNGANLFITNSVGLTPLHMVANSKRDTVECCRILLANGARDVPSMFGWTCLRYALCNNRHDIACLLLDYGARLEDVTFDAMLPSIPQWARNVVAGRELCRSAAILMMRVVRGGQLGSDVGRLIGQRIWATRLCPEWEDRVKSSNHHIHPINPI